MPEFLRDTIAVVVDPGYGDRLGALAAEMPVWVGDTPANRAAAEHVWASEGTHELTTFVLDPRESPQEALVRILPTIDLHHGEYSEVPPYSSLLVLGIAPSAKSRAALAEFGLVVAEETGERFRATRRESPGISGRSGITTR